MADVNIQVQAEVNQAVTNLGKVNTALGKTSTAAEGSGKGFKSLASSTDAATKSTKNFGMAASAIKGFIGGAVVAAVIKLGKEFVGLAADMEQSKVAFTTMLKSGEAAEAFLKDLQAFAASTPFEFTELQTAAKRMLAFGFEAEKVLPMMRDIGDTVAGLGLGSEGVNRVVLALGQMQAKGKVTGGEMMQLTEAGIPAWGFLAKAMGKTTAEVMKMSEQGLIPAGDAIQYILDGMRQDFGGMMAEQSKTAAGQMSNLKDNLVALETVIGEKLLPALKWTVNELIKVSDAVKTVITWTDVINSVWEEHRDEVLKTEKSYEKFAVEMVRSALVAGKFNGVAEKTAEDFLAGQISAENYAYVLSELTDVIGVYSEATWAATKQELDFGDAGVAGARILANYATAEEEAAEATAVLQAETWKATDAFSELNKQQIYNVAAAGLDRDAQIALAKEMGLLDETALNQLTALDALRASYDSGAIGAETYYDAVSRLADIINRLEGKDITINTTLNEYRRTFYEEYHPQTPGGNDNPVMHANGGPVYANQPGWVGERGPELFLPGRNGQIISNEDIISALRVANQSNTTNNYNMALNVKQANSESVILGFRAMQLMEQ